MSYQQKVLVICGPTAVGKTSFALNLTGRYPSELISADSRQVYRGLGLITGKDIPVSFECQESTLVLQGRPLTYYTDGNTRIWLVDVVNPDEPWSAALWRQAAGLIISDIHHRGLLPIVVGGTGFYIKTLEDSFPDMTVPPDPEIRSRLSGSNSEELFEQLKRLSPDRAASLNASDRENPRRLIRAIEIASSPPAQALPALQADLMQIGLSAPLDVLENRISARIHDRLSAGAVSEAREYAARYPLTLPAATSCGLKTLLDADPAPRWLKSELDYVKKQLVWFKKQAGISWFDTASPGWSEAAFGLIDDWLAPRGSTR